MSEQFEGMCCQIALDQCNKIFNDSNGKTRMVADSLPAWSQRCKNYWS